MGVGSSSGMGTASSYVRDGNIEAQIGMVLQAVPDTTVSLPVTNVLVTYVKNVDAPDGKGFFIQERTMMNKGLFVRVDPATLNPVPQAGDIVTFTVTRVGVHQGMKRAVVITGWARSEAGTEFQSRIPDLGGGNGLVAPNVADALQGRIYRLEVRPRGIPRDMGNGLTAQGFETQLVVADAAARELIMPTDLVPGLALRETCGYALTFVMWKTDNVLNLPIWSAADISPAGACSTRVVRVVAQNTTTVRVDFNGPVDAATLTPANLVLSGGGVTTRVVVPDTDRAFVLTNGFITASTPLGMQVSPNLRTPSGEVINGLGTTVAGTDVEARVRIQTLYGAGGMSPAYGNHFVVLFNASPDDQPLQGWLLQRANSNGSHVTADAYSLTGIIRGWSYALVTGAAVSGGAALPTADITLPGMTLASDYGSLALIQTGSPLGGMACIATSNAVVDLVGWGVGACAETMSTGGTLATFPMCNERQSGGCFDNNNNNLDVRGCGTPTVRNGASSPNVCP